MNAAMPRRAVTNVLAFTQIPACHFDAAARRADVSYSSRFAGPIMRSRSCCSPGARPAV